LKNKRVVGKIWEEKVIKFLIKENLEILGKNFYGKNGEIDIIVLDKNTMVFVEVKYRKDQQYGNAEEAINKRKMKRMYLTAQEYIWKKNWTGQTRFDIVAITKNNINWIKNSFWGDEIGI